MLVAKFGGTSVRDAGAMLGVMEILRSRIASHAQVVAVASATSGTTNTLLALAAHRDTDTETELRQRHHAIVDEAIGVTSIAHAAIDHLFDELATYLDALAILGECTDESRDTVVSFGERLSTTILHAICVHNGIDAVLVDARDLIRTDASYSSAAVDMDATRAQCASLRTHAAPLIITQGFIGATSDRRTTTLGRGGSDYTAAILGWACNASTIEIWTDVSGIYTCDPRVISDAAPIASLGFQHVRELALYGAKVIHPETIVPAVSASIPVRILNTFAPNEQGTTIVLNDATTDPQIAAVSILRDCHHVQTSASVAAHLRSAKGLDGAIVVDAEALDTGALVVRCTSIEHEQAFAALSETHNLNPAACGVLAVCHTGDWTPDQIAVVMQQLTSCDVLAVSAGATLTTLLVVVAESDVVLAAQRIHDVILRRR